MSCLVSIGHRRWMRRLLMLRASRPCSGVVYKQAPHRIGSSDGSEYRERESWVRSPVQSERVRFGVKFSSSSVGRSTWHALSLLCSVPLVTKLVDCIIDIVVYRHSLNVIDLSLECLINERGALYLELIPSYCYCVLGSTLRHVIIDATTSTLPPISLTVYYRRLDMLALGYFACNGTLFFRFPPYKNVI